MDLTKKKIEAEEAEDAEPPAKKEGSNAAQTKEEKLSARFEPKLSSKMQERLEKESAAIRDSMDQGKKI